MVDLLLTVETSVARGAPTEVASFGVVHAASGIKAGSVCAAVRAQLAVAAVEARWTGARVATVVVLFWNIVVTRRPTTTRFRGYATCSTHSAAASITARVPRTFVDLNLTAGPREPGQTGASVAALARVGTGCSVQTGLVVCAVVQIWREQKHRVSESAERPSQENPNLRETHLGCRTGRPIPPGSYTARAVDRCRGGSLGNGCSRRSNAH